MEAQLEDQTLAIASLEAELTSLQAGLAIKKTIQKNPKKPTKNVFFVGFFKFCNFF